MVNSLVPLLNLFVHYFSNESSESLSELENHPNMFMLEFYAPINVKPAGGEAGHGVGI